MNLSKALKITVISAAVLGAAVSLPWAFCDSAIETYALFGCADLNYFAPVPAPYTPADVSTVFWQIGFGNETNQTGQGTDGTGVQSKSNFNGNDHGLFVPDLVDAFARFGSQFPFPQGSVCLGSNNWANTGIDGCCDDTRNATPFSFNNSAYNGGFGPYLYPNDDNYLNPYQALYFKSIGYPGYLTYGEIQDYPSAVLLKTPGDDWFVLAAVQNMDRANDGTFTGPCNLYGGTNPAACDVRQGFYQFKDVKNGGPNAVRGSGNDVAPWQPAPRPIASCIANCSGAGTKTVHFEIGPVFWNHDGSSMLSQNPTMAPALVGRAPGVGVVDLLKKWNGLVNFDLEAAPVVTDPNGDVDYAALAWAAYVNPATTLPMTGMTEPISAATGDPTGPLAFDVDVPSDTCFRAHVHFGKTPEVSGTSTNATNCRIGKCGDVGYGLATTQPMGITCIGGALLSESIQNAIVTRSQGRYQIGWSTPVELSVTGFEIQALTNKGAKTLTSVSCKECSSGLGASYSVEVAPKDLGGGRLDGFRIVMQGGNGATADLPTR